MTGPPWSTVLAPSAIAARVRLGADRAERRTRPRTEPSTDPQTETGAETPPRGMRGSASVAVAAVVVAAVAVTVVVFEVAAFAAASARVRGAADLAALAAATALDGDATVTPPAAADRVAGAHDVELVSCACRSVPVEVTVATTHRSPFGLVAPRRVTATARATLVPAGTGHAATGPD